MDSLDEQTIASSERQERKVDCWREFEKTLRLPRWLPYEEIISVFRRQVVEMEKVASPMLFESFLLSVAIEHDRRLMALEKAYEEVASQEDQ